MTLQLTTKDVLDSLKELDSKIQDNRDEVTEKESHQRHIEYSTEVSQSTLDTKTSEVSSLEQQAEEYEREADSLENEDEPDKEKIDDLRGKVRDIESKILDLKGEVDVLVVEQGVLDSHLIKLKEEIQDLEEQGRALKNERDECELYYYTAVNGGFS